MLKADANELEMEKTRSWETLMWTILAASNTKQYR